MDKMIRIKVETYERVIKLLTTLQYETGQRLTLSQAIDIAIKESLAKHPR